MLATNLAVAAARSGMRTLLVDLDLQFGDSALTLAVTPRATIADLAASSGDDRRREARRVRQHRRRARARRAAGAAAPRGGRRGRPGRSSRRVLDAARNAYEAVVIDTGPLFDGGDARRARPHRPAAARLQPRGDVAQERPHRSGDDRPARLRRASASRSSRTASAQPAASSRDRRSSMRSRRRSRTSCPTIPAVPAAVNRAMPIVARRREAASSRARSACWLPSVFAAGPSPTEQTASTAPLLIARPTMSAIDRNGLSDASSDASVLAERLQVDRGTVRARCARSARRAEDEDPPDVHRPARQRLPQPRRHRRARARVSARSSSRS